MLMMMSMIVGGGAMRTDASKEAQQRRAADQARAQSADGGQRSQGSQEMAGMAASCTGSWLENIARGARERKRAQQRGLNKREDGSAKRKAVAKDSMDLRTAFLVQTV